MRPSMYKCTADGAELGGAGLLFSDQSLKLSFGDVWFNAPSQRTTRGAAEGQNLAGLLGAADANLPWNLATQGRPLVTLAEGAFLKLPTRRGEPTLTLLSPAPPQLNALFAVWAKELERLRRKQSDMPEPEARATRGGQGLDLKSLADRSTAVDHAPSQRVEHCLPA